MAIDHSQHPWHSDLGFTEEEWHEHLRKMYADAGIHLDCPPDATESDGTAAAGIPAPPGRMERLL